MAGETPVLKICQVIFKRKIWKLENLFVMVRLLDIAPNDIFNYDCGLAQDTEQLFQELSSFSEEEQRMAAAAARAVLQQIRYEKEHCKEEVSNKTNG